MHLPELRAQGDPRTGTALQPQDLPKVWNDDDQRLMKTSQEQGDQQCQVETEQALVEWAR